VTRQKQRGGCYEALKGVYCSDIGTGTLNTADIVAECAGTSVASVANGLDINGYSDWFLPSEDELNALYLQKDVVGGLSSWYWSSTERDRDQAYYQPMDTVNGSWMSKRQPLGVRAIRAF
jgi:hypothetical protein